MDSKLSEIAGIHSGDGYLRYTGKRKEFDLSGNYEEKDYYDFYLKKLFEDFFKINVNLKYFPKRKTYGFVIREKKVIKKLKDLGFPSGKKASIVRCPKSILRSDNIEVISSYVRGYFDTDGCLYFEKKKKDSYYYPRITISSVSKGLIEDVIFLLNKLEFKPLLGVKIPKGSTNEKIKYILYLNGAKNLELWIKKIGFSNPSKYTKYLVWKKLGHCPILNYKQRIYILNKNCSFIEKGL